MQTRTARPAAPTAAAPKPASAIYEGWVRHRRVEPSHEFRYPIFMTYLDLAELPDVLDRFPGWSARRRAIARFKRSDFIGRADQPLDEAVRDAVVERGGERPKGPIRLLSNLRYLGRSFNPVSFYFCMDEAGERVETVLAEVTNTPWGERHSYLIGREEENPGEPMSRVIRGHLDKAFHVSPLMGMDYTYDWRTTEPGEGLVVHIESSAQGHRAFDATLSLKRRDLSRSTMRRILIRYPAMTTMVGLRIYWQALRLKLKGARYFSHPDSGKAAT
ncbi:DUF1365 domain-containing protein [soil metagenome]